MTTLASLCAFPSDHTLTAVSAWAKSAKGALKSNDDLDKAAKKELKAALSAVKEALEDESEELSHDVIEAIMATAGCEKKEKKSKSKKKDRV